MDTIAAAEPNSEFPGFIDHTKVPGMELLKVQVMAEIERMLSQKDEALWRRGQSEIRKLKSEQEKTAQHVTKLQEGQAALEGENQKIRAALLEITTKFELVVQEMRHVLSVLPVTNADNAQHSPSPSDASTTTPERSFVTAAAQTPVPMWHARGLDAECMSGLLLTELPSLDTQELRSAFEDQTFSTPPRLANEVAESVKPAATSTPPLPWQGSVTKSLTPAASPAVLSLATALPSTSGSSSAPAAASPGAKCLHLAEHLLQQAKDVAAECTNAPEAAPSRPVVSSATPVVQDTKAVAAPFELVNIVLIKKTGFITLGVEVNQVTDQVDGSTLRIESIDEHGLVGQHNLQQDSEASKVHVGDHIIEVNGIRDDPDLILGECRESQRLAFVLARASRVLTTRRPVLAERTYNGEFNSSADSAGYTFEEFMPSDKSTVSNDKVTSPSALRMRPDAQVFVPSGNKEVPTPSTSASTATSSTSAPPGLERLQVTGLKAVCELSPAEETSPSQEVNRALFH